MRIDSPFQSVSNAYRSSNVSPALAAAARNLFFSRRTFLRDVPSAVGGLGISTNQSSVVSSRSAATDSEPSAAGAKTIAASPSTNTNSRFRFIRPP